jgi:hypothetical protein
MIKNSFLYMTDTELYSKILAKLPITTIHPLHQAILEECCENVLANNQGITDPDQLILGVYTGFLAALAAAKSIVKSAITTTEAEQATLQYRGQTFIISATSSFLQE